MRETLLGKLLLVLSRATLEESVAIYRFATRGAVDGAACRASSRRARRRRSLLRDHWPRDRVTMRSRTSAAWSPESEVQGLESTPLSPLLGRGVARALTPALPPSYSPP